MRDDHGRPAWDRLWWWAGAVVLGWAVLLAAWTTQPVPLVTAGAVGVAAVAARRLARRAPTAVQAPDGGPAEVGEHPRTAAPGPGQDAGPPDDAERRLLAGLSDSELCWAWRNSYFAAQHAAADPDRLDRVSRTRRGYLDEIQRRDPAGFDAWLTAGARAASNPARYWRSDA